MATKIVTKNSSTASAVPTASDLVQGELAVNVADKRLFTEDNAGAIVELGTNPSTIDINAGTIDGTTVGASSASTGAFTTLTATGAFTSRGIDDNADAIAITIDSSENVGIGTSSPSAKLTLNDAGQQVGIDFKEAGTTRAHIEYDGAIPALELGTNGAANVVLKTSNTERLRIDSSGNVGIGETDPDSTLTVKGSAHTNFQVKSNSESTKAFIQTVQDSDVRIGSSTNHPVSFYQNGTERMRIDSSGNVGIATAGYGTYLSGNRVISLGSGTTIRAASSGAPYITLASNAYHDASAWKYVQTHPATTYEQYNGTHTWSYAASGTSGNSVSFSEAMRIDASGNLLVGATTLANVNNIISNHLFEGGNSTAGNAAVGVYNNTGTANCAAFNVLNRDASTDTSNRFVQFYANVTSSGATAMGGIVGNGASNVQFAALSDVREKTNIESINGSLDKIKALNPVEFDWIASGEHCKAGFVAQEVEEVFPEFVVENMASEGEEERKGLTGGMTGGIVAHLVKAIQEQQILIESLTARIAALEE